MFPEGQTMLVHFYPINLIVVYPLNENKPQLLASFESVAKQLAIFFGRFWSLSPLQFSSLKNMYYHLIMTHPFYIFGKMQPTHFSPSLPVNYYPMVYLYKLYISEGNMIKTTAKGRPNL